MNDIGEWAASIITAIVVVYVSYVLLDAFVKITPEFAETAKLLFVALLFGVVFFFRYGLFGRSSV